MLTHPTLDKLQRLKFTGMAAALTEQRAMPDRERLSFEERLGLLVDRELTVREDRRLSNRLRQARLRHPAALKDVDYRHPPRPGPGAHRPARRRAVAAHAPQCPHHRPYRRG